MSTLYLYYTISTMYICTRKRNCLKCRKCVSSRARAIILPFNCTPDQNTTCLYTFPYMALNYICWHAASGMMSTSSSVVPSPTTMITKTKNAASRLMPPCHRLIKFNLLVVHLATKSKTHHLQYQAKSRHIRKMQRFTILAFYSAAAAVSYA